MPHINLPGREPRKQGLSSKKFSIIYNTPTWKRLRKIKFAMNPLCEPCLRKDPPVTRQTQDVHHKTKIDIDHIDWDLAYDINNLESVCRECHVGEHKVLRPLSEKEKRLQDLKAREQAVRDASKNKGQS